MSEHEPSIAIMTDSTSDLPVELVQQYGIHIVPLYVLWGDEQLREGVDILPKEFYRRIRTDPVLPTTSQPTPGDFIQAIKATGASAVVIITISSEMSGTYASAIAAQQQLDIPVRVLDSRGVSMALGWQVVAAARAKERGEDLDAIVAAAQQARGQIHTYFTVETLEYLYKGGRIGGASHLIGTVLQLKPLLAVDTSTGQVEAVERIRSRKRALQRIVEVLLERVDVARPLSVVVLEGDAPEEAAYLEGQVRSACEIGELYTQQITPVVGTHAGPGVVGLSAWQE